MEVEYDRGKRDKVLEARGLDLARAGDAFAGFHLTRPDIEHSGVETRYVSVGLIDSEVIIIIWTERGDACRIITMWKANEKERAAYFRERDRHG